LAVPSLQRKGDNTAMFKRLLSVLKNAFSYINKGFDFFTAIILLIILIAPSALPKGVDSSGSFLLWVETYMTWPTRIAIDCVVFLVVMTLYAMNLEDKLKKKDEETDSPKNAEDDESKHQAWCKCRDANLHLLKEMNKSQNPFSNGKFDKYEESCNRIEEFYRFTVKDRNCADGFKSHARVEFLNDILISQSTETKNQQLKHYLGAVIGYMEKNARVARHELAPFKIRELEKFYPA